MSKVHPSVLGQPSQLAPTVGNYITLSERSNKAENYSEEYKNKFFILTTGRSEGYYLHRLLTHTFEEQHVLPRLSQHTDTSVKGKTFPSKTHFVQPPYPGVVGPLHTCSLVFPPQVICKRIRVVLSKFRMVDRSSHTKHLLIS